MFQVQFLVGLLKDFPLHLSSSSLFILKNSQFPGEHTDVPPCVCYCLGATVGLISSMLTPTSSIF